MLPGLPRSLWHPKWSGKAPETRGSPQTRGEREGRRERTSIQETIASTTKARIASLINGRFSERLNWRTETSTNRAVLDSNSSKDTATDSDLLPCRHSSESPWATDGTIRGVGTRVSSRNRRRAISARPRAALSKRSPCPSSCQPGFSALIRWIAFVKVSCFGIIEEMRSFVASIGSEQDKKHRQENPTGGIPHFEIRFAEVAS